MAYRLLLVLLAALPGVAGAASLAGKPAPALVATTLDGEHFDLAAHRGEVVIVNYWASWCEPCRQELPALAEFHRRHHSEGLQVLAVSVDDPEDFPRMRQLAAGLPFPVAVAARAEARGYGRIWRLPLSFVIDRRGQLVADGGSGARKLYDAATLDAEVLPLLRQPP